MAENISMEREFINKLTETLEVNLEDERFGVKELAKAVGISRSQLHRRIQAYNGNSTSQFIREYRLQKAMRLLRENVATASEIAYRVGFSSPTYFNTCFKEFYGFPPGEAKLRIVKSEEIDPNLPIGDNNQNYSLPLKKLKTNRRWIIGLSIGIGIILLLIASDYLGAARDEDVTSTVNPVTENSIAVLPFKNWSGNPDLEYISDGMTDAIITRLSVVDDLEVIPFASVLKYKSSDQDVSTITEELGVQNILQGNFQLSGDVVKITLHLIDGASNIYWSEVYTGKWKTDRIFEIQAQVAETVVNEMNIDLTGPTLVSIRKNPTTYEEAYDLWLQGNYQMDKFSRKGFLNALNFYERALSIDATFLEAHISAAYLYLFGGASWGLYKEENAWFNAKQHLTKALELDSSNIYAKRGLVDGLYLYTWDFETMEKEYLENSNISWVYCLQTGRFEGLLPQIDAAMEQNPTGPFNPLFKIQTLYFLNRVQEAKEILEQTDVLFDDQIMYLRLASRYYYYMGEFEKSKELLTKLLNNFPDRPPLVLWLTAIHASRDGNQELVARTLEELHKRYKEDASGSPAWFTALYYSSIGDKENAFSWLEKSFDRHEVEMIWLREQPVLRSLRSDPRYVELYHKVGFPMPPHPN